jgi:hypothetical protein
MPILLHKKKSRGTRPFEERLFFEGSRLLARADVKSATWHTAGVHVVVAGVCDWLEGGFSRPACVKRQLYVQGCVNAQSVHGATLGICAPTPPRFEKKT